MYLAREHTSETLPAIGAGFGGRGHTTVMHAVPQDSRERVASDPEVSTIVERAVDTALRARDADRSG